jgi:tetratricopeptide (TPR) repeat protein
MHSAIGQPDRAREHFLRVVRENPGHADAHYALAVLLRDVEQDWVQADYHFREYLKINPGGRHAAEARDSLLKNVP